MTSKTKSSQVLYFLSKTKRKQKENELKILYFYLIDCVFGFHLYIHGHKKGEEEQNSTRKSHQFAGRKFGIWTNSWLNVTILKLKSKLKSERKFSCRYLFETDDCDNGTGDHYGNGRHEHRVQDFVFA